MSPRALGYVHINSLEFVVLIVQLAGIIARIEDLEATGGDPLAYFPRGLPAIPSWLGECDNTVSVSWENKATAKTHHGQGLVSVYSELRRRRMIHGSSNHLAGKDNDVADAISRNDFSLPLHARSEQLYRKHPFLADLDYFQPSPGVIQLLS